jgi:hypothetical protein
MSRYQGNAGAEKFAPNASHIRAFAPPRDVGDADGPPLYLRPVQMSEATA